MFCSNCGKELDAESKFCKECGTQTANTAETTKIGKKAVGGFSDDEIRAELKKYKKYEKRSCFECGYQGICGVTNERILPRWKSVVATIIIFAIIIIFYIAVWTSFFVFILGGCLWGVVSFYYTSCYKICPNCQNKLK